MRERIEGRSDPRERERRKRAAAPPDPEFVLMEVRDFVELAESGAYIAGDRRMSRTERTKWRVTFRLLATEAQSALHATDSGPAEEAMELMIDLACHADGCFRWDDPLEAAKFVLSKAVSALWDTVLDVRGAAEFTARAVPQLMRWNGSTTANTPRSHEMTRFRLRTVGRAVPVRAAVRRTGAGCPGARREFPSERSRGGSHGG